MGRKKTTERQRPKNKIKQQLMELGDASLEEILGSGQLPLRIPDAKIVNACQTLMSNGFNEIGAFRDTFPEFDFSRSMLKFDAKFFFRRPEVQDTLKQLVLGRTGTLTQGELTWAIDTWRNWIELSILDYWGLDGQVLSIQELKALPRWMQTPIKSMEIDSYTDKDGQTHNKVKITLIDKERALHDMARAMKWITAHVKVEADDHLKLLAKSMAEANERTERMANTKIIEHVEE